MLTVHSTCQSRTLRIIYSFVAANKYMEPLLISTNLSMRPFNDDTLLISSLKSNTPPSIRFGATKEFWRLHKKNYSYIIDCSVSSIQWYIRRSQRVLGLFGCVSTDITKIQGGGGGLWLINPKNKKRVTDFGSLNRYLDTGKAAEDAELGDGDGHLGLVVAVLVGGRTQRVQHLGEVLVRVRLDRQRLGHRQNLHEEAWARGTPKSASPSRTGERVFDAARPDWKEANGGSA